MKRKITLSEELFHKMVDLRRNGATYPEIMQTLGVSKWKCMHYLKGIKIDKHFVQKEWEKAQEEGAKVLKDLNFSHILDLNKICPSPYWDYYAEKDKDRWLIDVTIDKRKDMVGKVLHTLKSFKHAILLKEKKQWKLIELNFTERKIN